MKQSVRFGTDGIRGLVGVEITSAVAYSVGRAAAELISGEGRLVVAWDTRESSEGLARAFTSGALAGRAEVEHLGVVPTPVLASVCARHGMPGCMITASHNLYQDNGLKLFTNEGLKLSAQVEAAVESRSSELIAALGPGAEAELLVGTVDEWNRELVDQYVEEQFRSADLAPRASLRVGFDFANGAGSYLGPTVFDQLEVAEVHYLGTEPDGRNINLGVGSTAPEALMGLVEQHGLDVAFAFDGDGDRVMAIDEQGELIDGDALIAILAADLAERDLLNDRAIVVSNWSNLGLFKAMAERDIEVVQSEVGDKYILELLNERHLSLGGEQSGHIILRDRTTTGDGMLVAAELLSIISRRGVPVSQLASAAMVRVPQVAHAVRVTADPKRIVAYLDDVLAIELSKLGADGRAVLRPSGTEPVVRVMAEAPTVATAESVVVRLGDEVRACDAKLAAETS